MLCLCGALLNPDVAPAALPEPYRQRPSRAAGSFHGHFERSAGRPYGHITAAARSHKADLA